MRTLLYTGNTSVPGVSVGMTNGITLESDPNEFAAIEFEFAETEDQQTGNPIYDNAGNIIGWIGGSGVKTVTTRGGSMVVAPGSQSGTIICSDESYSARLFVERIKLDWSGLSVSMCYTLHVYMQGGTVGSGGTTLTLKKIYGIS